MNRSEDLQKPKKALRSGFSTGSAVAGAARAALRNLLSHASPQVVAVRLPGDSFIPIPICRIHTSSDRVWASVIKDAGDDPDVTHRAELRAGVRLCRVANEGAGVRLIAGHGVGVVKKPGLPVRVGEPAINPVPREMVRQNLMEELRRCSNPASTVTEQPCVQLETHKPSVLVPFLAGDGRFTNLLIEVEVEVPKGVELARHTLNPRLGIVGGISILGTTGIVKPFSHEAYEETIDLGLDVAASNGCREVVLSTGGKSEKYAQSRLADLHEEAFVQIADFFAYAVNAARAKGFATIVHSAFFGKVVKMAQGHAYTHAHKSAMDLEPLARLAQQRGYGAELVGQLAAANTARHALELLMGHRADDVIEAVAREAVRQSVRMAGPSVGVRLLLFDYDGRLMADLQSGPGREDVPSNG